ncbi:MAG TPA: GDSL-type esterase/lipase family protein [Beijerinckiaceae bacterium]
MTRWRASGVVALCFGLASICLVGEAQAQVVALGASNTAGKGVSPSYAWPSQLEGMLRARGIDAQVINAGVNGDDTSGMLARVDRSVPAGTRLVILDKAASNDRRRGVDTEGNVGAIVQALRARGIRTIVIPGMHGWANRQLQPDGIHITEEGHAAVATRLLPLVAAELGGAGGRGQRRR